MKREFDIQLFAEDFAEDSTFDTDSTEVEELVQETSTEQSEQEPIPAELEGLDEQYARAALKEWQEQQAEAENQPEQPQAVQQVDELTQLRQERDQLRTQLQEYVKKPQAVQPQQPIQTQPQVQPPPLTFTKDNIEKFNQIVDTMAMQASGLTKDDIASFEFSDDGDEKQERWKYAREQARIDLFNKIREERQRYVADQQALLQRQQASAQAYNEFAQREGAEPDFQQVFNFAATDYFRQQSPLDQQIVNDAYIRITKGVASSQDTFIMRNYYLQAKAAYRGGGVTKPQAVQQNVQAKQKPKAPPNLPKIDQASGTTAKGNGISVEELEKMIDSDIPISQFPKQYRDLMSKYV